MKKTKKQKRHTPNVPVWCQQDLDPSSMSQNIHQLLPVTSSLTNQIGRGNTFKRNTTKHSKKKNYSTGQAQKLAYATW